MAASRACRDRFWQLFLLSAVVLLDPWRSPLLVPTPQPGAPAMQVWAEAGTKQEGVDRVLGQDLEIGEDGTLRLEGRAVGCAVDVSTADGQSKARSLAGCVEWILLEFGEWTMIPVENIVAACNGGPTRVAARLRSAEQVIGAAFALQIGADALLVPQEVIETALIAKAQRGEVVPAEAPVERSSFKLEDFEVLQIRDGGVGQRVCVDLTCLLEIGEGMLIGSSSSSLTLVHGETLQSDFVPSRPFRVNAGAVHAYILMADDSTKYLSKPTGEL